ncbi:HD-GYP domain-containing protein [Bacillus timonensis]|nr:HD-GYP domain-containing protein [Bacillus timonensis]
MKGFQLYTSNKRIEEVKQGSSILSLLGRGDGTEVLMQQIFANKLFYIYPSDRKETMEFFYIISGQVYCEALKKELKENDYFYVQELAEPVLLKTMIDTKLLWISTEPIYHYISENIQKLIKVVKEVEQKDRYTFNHSERVQEYAMKMGIKLKLSKERLDNLFIASVLHDIGKIHIPEEILNKPGKLTDEEFALIKKHPTDGAEMVKDTYYKDIAPIIEQHHERLNGTGYPLGLKDEDILLEAKIIAVSDTYDAMTEDRAYRKAFSTQHAVDEICQLIGTHYDHRVVDAFIEVLKEEGKI